MSIEKTQRLPAQMRRKVMANPEERTSNDDDVGPSWLLPLLNADFFMHCRIHDRLSKNDCNLYCIDCMSDALCQYCYTSQHEGHVVLQIRKASYHNGIHVSEVEKFLDVSEVQTYIINKGKIVYLNGRPQPRRGKDEANSCESCYRGLNCSFRFCSIGCKLWGIRRDPTLTFAVKSRDWTESSESQDSFLTKKRKQRQLASDRFAKDDGGEVLSLDDTVSCNSSDDANGSSTIVAAATPPTPSYRRVRRRGIPRRSPLF